MRSIYLFLLLNFMVCFRIGAQIIPFQNFTIKNGLPNNIIYDIEQDHKGYMWFATQAGAVRFDGHKFIKYSVEDGLPDNNILDIFVDSRDRIWFATATGGLAFLENNKIRVFTQANGLIADYSKKVFEDMNQHIWYISTYGLSIILPDTILNYDAGNSPIKTEIEYHYVAKDGTIWIVTADELIYYRDGVFNVFDNDLLNHTWISEICEDKKGSYWIATDGNGIIHFTNNGSSGIKINDGPRSNKTFAISSQLEDTILVSCSYPGGLYKIHNNQVVMKWEDELTDFKIHQILVDKLGRIWLSTPEHGLMLLEKNELSKIDVQNGLANNQINKLFEDKNGNIWIATNNGLSKYGKVIFHIYNEGFIGDKTNIQSIATYGNSVYSGTYSGLNIIRSKQTVTRPAVPIEKYILSILPLNENQLWLATDEGLSYLNNKEVHHYYFRNSFSQSEAPGWITDLKKLDESLFCATDRGLIKFVNKNFVQIPDNPDFEDNSIWSLAVDSLKNIWCATVNGLAIYDGNTFHYYDTLQGLPHRYCNDITFDSKGFAWIATDKGLSRIKLKSDWTIECKNIDKSLGLKSDIIFSVLADKEGYIWAGHNFGLDRIDVSNMHITHYGAMEGFLPVETSLGAAATSLGRDLWFGTVDGVVRYIRDNDFVYTDPPLVYINEIKFFDDTSSVSRFAEGKDSITGLPLNLILPHNKNNLVFSYIGLHYTIIEKNQYKYKLEGYDNDWSGPVSSIETPPYRKLPPGSYIFKVMAANCDGVWTEKPVEFAFIIRPPFYKTWWFIVFEILFGLAVLLTIMRLRVRKLQHDKEVLTQKVKERTVEVEMQRDQIAFQKKEITDSIVYAERIQSAVLPSKEFIDTILSDYFILFKPRNIVSGDFYWMSKVENKLIVVAADCTGHGVPGAFMSMLGISILNEIVNSKTAVEAGRILDILRDHLTKTLGQTSEDCYSKDGMDLALVVIDYSSMKLQFAGAYNPMIHINKEGITIYKGDKMPVGIHIGVMPQFTTHEIPISRNDCIYIFSDGYADQFGGPDGKKFKSVQLQETLVNISSLPMSEQKSRLNETITNWMGINDQIDDMLIIGIRI